VVLPVYVVTVRLSGTGTLRIQKKTFIVSRLSTENSHPLKVLSSEMDLAEIRFFDRHLIDRETRMLLEKFARPTSCESL
jgi:hypothetical protein